MVSNRSWFRPSMLSVLLSAVMCLFPAALAAEDSQVTMAEEEPGAQPPAQSATYDRLGVEEPTALARTELTVIQGVHGAILGVQTCVVLQCESTYSFAALSTIGVGAGVASSLVLTRNRGITPGEANAVNSAVVWAGMLGLGVGVLTGMNHRQTMVTTIGTRLLGVSAGYGLARSLGLTAGDVNIVNAAGFWSATLYFLSTAGILQLEQSPQAGLAGTLGFAVAGGAAGGVLANYYPMSRRRVGMIVGSGAAGALAGAGIPRLIGGEDTGVRSLSTGATVGAIGGLALGTVLTRNFDDSDEYRRVSTSFSITPGIDGDSLLGSVSGRF